MPLQLSVGVSRKQGLPGYSSVGASCHVELELDAALLANHPGTFQQQVAEAYQACSQAVQAELARQRDPRRGSREVAFPDRARSLPFGEQEQHDPCQAPSPADDHGRSSPGDSANAAAPSANGSGQSDQSHAATPRQQNFLHQLVAQIRGLTIPRLEELSRQRFGKPLGQLASSEASQLIDLLKDIRGGQLALDDAFADEGAVI